MVLITINGHMNIRHELMKVRIAKVDRAGLDSGRIILKKMYIKPAPSMWAASSRSRGIERKYCLKRNVPYAVNAAGRIIAL